MLIGNQLSNTEIHVASQSIYMKYDYSFSVNDPDGLDSFVGTTDSKSTNNTLPLHNIAECFCGKLTPAFQCLPELSTDRCNM